MLLSNLNECFGFVDVFVRVKNYFILSFLPGQGYRSVAQCLPSKYKVLSLISVPNNNNKLSSY